MPMIEGELFERFRNFAQARLLKRAVDEMIRVVEFVKPHEERAAFASVLNEIVSEARSLHLFADGEPEAWSTARGPQ